MSARVFDTGLRAADLAQDGGRAPLVETPWGTRAVVRRGDGAPVAIEPWCPHLDGPLWEGGRSGDEIQCPWHRWRYSLRDGSCTWAPPMDEEEAAESRIEVDAVEENAAGHLIIVRAEGAPPA